MNTETKETEVIETPEYVFINSDGVPIDCSFTLGTVADVLQQLGIDLLTPGKATIELVLEGGWQTVEVFKLVSGLPDAHLALCKGEMVCRVRDVLSCAWETFLRDAGQPVRATKVRIYAVVRAVGQAASADDIAERFDAGEGTEE